MNKILYTALQCKAILLTLLIGLIATSNSYCNSDEAELDEKIENRILSLGSSVDARYSSEVKSRVDQYIRRQKKMSEILIGRSAIYFPTFERILKEKGIPDDIKYLSVVESGLKPVATSGAGAAGLWQFMRPTGRMMGLKITRTVDERRDVEKSTAAAADYLLKLYNQFDDWTLAIAAYNCGPGNMRKAIRRSGGKRNFWEIKKFLPKETREYVPKFIAISYVMNYYYDHDITPKMPEEGLVNTSSAKVFESINFRKLGKEVDIDLEILKTLNPSFIRNYIPKSIDGKYTLVLPTPEMIIVAGKYHIEADLPQIEEGIVEEVVYTPRPKVVINNIPKALNISKRSEDTPLQLRSMYLHNVALGRKKQKKIKKQEAYNMNANRKSQVDIAKIIAGSKKSL